MKAKAKKTDSWLGIKAGVIYPVKVVNRGESSGGKRERLFVNTDGYIVPFDKKHFIMID